MPARIEPHELTSVLPVGGVVYVQGCSGESALFGDAVMAGGDALGAMRFTGIFVPGFNRRTYLPNSACRVTTFFQTPELTRGGAAVELLPLCYADVIAHLRTTPIDAAIFSVAPPDAQGLCSFGPVVDFLAELWPRIPTRIAHINPAIRRTRGPTGIPFEALTAYCEAEQPLPEAASEATDDVARAIAAHVANFIPDEATVQAGLGKIPGAVLARLTDRRGITIHSGLIGDSVLDLVEAGAATSVTTGVAIGSRRLYDAIAGEAFVFQPVSYTHSSAVIAALPRFVAINSALEVDLFGQAYAERGPRGLVSGPGGASDFARGARAGGGLRIVALPAAAGAASRIVAPGEARGPVSLGRMDVDIVVTEHGAADLRGQSHENRAAELIAIAPPDHRERLDRAWRECQARF